MQKNNREGKASVIDKDVFKEILDDPEIKMKKKVLMLIQYFTAARIGETCSLKKSDIGKTHINFGKSDTKTKRTKQVVINGTLRPWLERYLATLPRDNPYLFPGYSRIDAKGNKVPWHISTDTAEKKYDAIFTKYFGEKHGYSTHTFRRSVLTHAHANGATLADLTQLSGHHSIIVLQQYIDCSDNAQEKVLSLVGF